MKAIILVSLIIAVSILDVGALSVVSDYLENGTLILLDDESKLYGIRLQNPSPQEIMLKVTYDDTIAKIVDYEEVYTLLPKTSRAIFFNVSAPKKFKPNEIYAVGYTVHQLSGSGSGVPILLKISRSFNVKIIKNPGKFYLNYPYIAYAVIALASLIYIFRKRHIPLKNKVIKHRKIIKGKH